MDSVVSEASTMPLLDPSHSPAFAGVPSRRHPPVKRQASALSGSELTSQTADFLRQQQMGWVQMWPMTYQLQHGQQQLSSWDAGSGSCMLTQQLPGSCMQQAQQASTAGPMSNGYSHVAATGGMTVPAGPVGADPAVAAAAPASTGFPAAGAAAARPGPVAMQAPAHRLPKRRASTPHLLAADNNQPQMYKCVPHVGGPDCQCTSCLCARTDKLCQRLIAQRSAQDGMVQAGGAAAGWSVLAPAQHQQQLLAQQQHQQQLTSQQQQLMAQQHQHQQQLMAQHRHQQQLMAQQQHQQQLMAQQQGQQQQGQQQQEARSRGHSPCHMKRRSFELPPTSKCRRSQDGRSPSSSSSPPVGQGLPSLQQMPPAHAYAGSNACGPVLNDPTMPAPSLLTSTSSGQLRGQFQHLSVSCSPFEDPAGPCAAAAAAAFAQQQVYGDAALGPREVGSAHSTANLDTDEDVDRELERMLAQVGWPLQLPACDTQHKPAGMQQQVRHAPQQHQPYGMQSMQPLQAGMQQQMGVRPACSMNPAAAVTFAHPGAAASAAHTGYTLMMPQQQQQYSAGAAGPASSYHAGGCALPTDAACADDTAGLLGGLEEELRLPSFDRWGDRGLQQGLAPGGLDVPELCPSELQLLDELLESTPGTNPEEPSLVDLLLN